jgi:prophage regulatory protein
MRILRWDDLVKITGLSKRTIARYELEGTFPKRRKIGKVAVGWLESEVDEWMLSRPVAEPDHSWGITRKETK